MRDLQQLIAAIRAGLPAGADIDHPVLRQATTGEIAVLQSWQTWAATQQQTQVYNAANSNQKLYFVNFDGTGNNKDNPTAAPTNVERLDDVFRLSPNIESRYYKGAGNQSFALTGIIDTVTGASVLTTARQAYDEFVAWAKDQRDANPNTAITVSGAGFSRGSATLSVFMNIVHKEGVPDTTSTRIVNAETGAVTYSAYLVPPGQVDLGTMIMYERVATGTAREQQYLQIPPSVKSVLSIVAINEYDSRFQLDSAIDKTRFDPRINEIYVAGAHSDVGSGYWTGLGIPLRTLDIAYSFLRASGVPLADKPAAFDFTNQDNTVHDSYKGRFREDNPYNYIYVDNRNRISYRNPEATSAVIDSLGGVFGNLPVEQRTAFTNILTKLTGGKFEAISGALRSEASTDPDAVGGVIVVPVGRTEVRILLKDLSDKGGGESDLVYEISFQDPNNLDQAVGFSLPFDTVASGDVSAIPTYVFNGVPGLGASLQYPEQSPGSETLSNLLGGGTFIDSLSLIRAIQSGQPLPIAASGLRLASGIDALINTPAQANLILSGASAAASSILSIISLQRSLQNGDSLGALSAGGQALNFAADAYLKLAAQGLIDGAGNVAAAQLHDFLSGSTTQLFDDGTSLVTSVDPTAGFLPYLNLAVALDSGDPVGIASSVLAFIPGAQPIAFALQAFQLIDGLFGGGSNPGQLSDTWGNARLRFTGSVMAPAVTYDAYGTESAGPMLGNLLGQMNNVLANAQAAQGGSAAGHPLGLIPMRMPSLSVTRNPYTHLAQWRITDINPLTAAANHPGAFYDDSGRSYGSIDSPEALQSLSERFIRSSLAREAIAPLWEVQTAYLRQALGDPNAGYGEEETAARLGRQGVDPNTLPTLSRLGFRPVLLDLNSDGLFSTFNLVPTGQLGTATNPAHAFDAQDDGYLRSTGWVKSSEGILVLDRNLNGTIDSGRDVFSNGKVNDASKGTNSLAWVDANLDGVIDSNDPVFNELQVWVDANGNNQSEAGELNKLGLLGITALNYAGNTFTRGVAGAGGTVTLTTGLLASPDLAAERDGTLSLIVNNEGTVLRACLRKQISVRRISGFSQHRCLKKRSRSQSLGGNDWRVAPAAHFTGMRNSNLNSADSLSLSVHSIGR